MRERDSDDDLEAQGSDLDQMIAMLERSEIDYDVDHEDEEETIVDINGSSRMTFNEEGELLAITLIPN